jgi:hypothetical protein
MKRAVFALLLMLLAVPAAAAATPAPVSNWVETGKVEFHGMDGIYRSQGVASDGSSLFFSWNIGLIRTSVEDPSTPIVDHSLTAIPDDLSDSGHNHVGDIDLADGILYAPIEDGPDYAEPWVVLYDAETLDPTGQRYLLPVSVQRDGVPWIAVDQPRGVAYSMEWNDTGKLFVYRLSDFELIDTVTLSEPTPRIQGAKVFRGNLYASRDNGSEKSIVAIDPETGQVTHLFDRNTGEEYEAEGIGFIRRPTGTEMVATGIRQDTGLTEMRIYRIGGDVTAPVLSKVKFKKKKLRRGTKAVLMANASEPVTVSGRWLRCVGPERKPCSKQKATGKVSTLSLDAGGNRCGFPTGGLKSGFWRLRITPTDQADIVGASRLAQIKVLRKRR